MKQTLAILGRQPEFGLVELESIVGGTKLQPLGEAAALVDQSLNIDRLGGSIKIGEVLYDGVFTDLAELPVDPASLPLRDSKTPFAISLYGVKGHNKALAVGLALKKRLRQVNGSSVRLITPKNGASVSAAELHHNQVLEHGFELLLVQAGRRLVIARTTGVQDVDWYSRRDYDRPARSARVGMLPPKLAQIMVNTTTAPLVVDPFCGTGVVLQEALLVGRRAIGSDLNPKMVAASRENLAWLANERQIDSWSVAEGDARHISLPSEPLAIVSEGYLGPHLSKPLPASQLAKTRAELKELYHSALANLGSKIAAGSQISITAPVWKDGTDLGLIDDLGSIGYNLIDFTTVSSHKLIYRRADQQVGRQLLILRKL